MALARKKLDLPEKAEIEGLVDGRLVVKVNEDFTPSHGAPVKAGSLIALDLAQPLAAPETIFVPNARQSIDEVAATKNHVVAAIYDNVRGRAYVFARSAAGWTQRLLEVPDNASVHITAASQSEDRFFFEVTGFLQPTTLYLADAAGIAPPAKIKALPPKFDASHDTVDQHEATSTDGTKIPYFVVHPEGHEAGRPQPHFALRLWRLSGE